MSLPEVLLWKALREHDLPRFRRQHPAGPFVLDFFCPEHGLAVEVDGASHGTGDLSYDARRDEWLGRQGKRVLRLSAELVLSDMDAALATIAAALKGEL